MTRKKLDHRELVLLGRVKDHEELVEKLTRKLLSVSRSLDKALKRAMRHRKNLHKYRLEKASRENGDGFVEGLK